MRAFEWDGDTIRILDQTLLPKREVWRTLRTVAQLAEAIEKLRIRGAPALGIAGAAGVAQAALRAPKTRDARGVIDDAEFAGETLAQTRPTAVNLRWAIERTLNAGRAALSTGADRDGVVKALVEEAHAIASEDAAACDAIARAGQEFLARGARVMTHCNTGLLCTGGTGTALGVIRLAHDSGKKITVLATETRPLLQGARLTAWELGTLGIPHALIPDSAGPALLARGEADVVVVGADRVAANGDVANKIGTYALALAAREAGVPFVVAAPVSTIDLSVSSGEDIVVEERNPDEVLEVFGVRVAPQGATARNPAFDVTPARLVTAIVTENGVARPPYRRALRGLVQPLTRSPRRLGHGGSG
jgi:methylthioribose-1-phosphate isomerase